MNKFNFFKKFLENPLSKTIESRWVGRKVSNINEFRDYLNGGIKWHGELDNGHYFLIFVHEGIVNISISEREMMLPFELERLVATHESLDEYINCKDVNERLALGVGLRLNAPTLMLSITFKDMMQLFGWEYDSDKVEIFNMNFD